jgi:protein TonB
MANFLGILAAIVLHVLFLLFGGILFPETKDGHGTTQEVELLDSAVEEKKEEEQKPEEVRDVEAPPEEAPDAEEVIRNLEQPAPDAAPALEAASLASIGDALLGQGAGGDFAGAMSFASGGVIGGKGKAGGGEDALDNAFSMSDIDQKPQVLFQAEPVFPLSMRGKKIEGRVTVIFVVDSKGKVLDPRSTETTHEAFERPAVDAVKQWKFEPAVKAGKRVACKMRVVVRFPVK